MFNIFAEAPYGRFYSPMGCISCNIPAGHQRDGQPGPDAVIELDSDFSEYLTRENAGQIFLCGPCLLQMADSLGYITPEKAKTLRDKNRDLGLKAKRLEDSLSRFNEAAAALRSLDS